MLALTKQVLTFCEPVTQGQDTYFLEKNSQRAQLHEMERLWHKWALVWRYLEAEIS